MKDPIQTEVELDEVLTRPRPELIAFIRRVASPLLILGAGGKMGATLAVLAHRAAQAANHPLETIAVSRFTDEPARRLLEAHGVKTWTADLLERQQVQALPDSANVIYLVGLKFGTAQNPALTWAINTQPPAHVVERFGAARIVALSTGNVYPQVPVSLGGAGEDQPVAPVGDYASAAVARERVFESASRKNGTPVALLRLNYAVELRYGVLVDIARKVWRSEPIDVSNGYFNCIWQGDANEMILRSLALATSPAATFNLTGLARLSVREMALQFAALLGRPAKLVGEEFNTALLSKPEKLCAVLGLPPTPLDQITASTAHWIKNDGRYWNKPTHFEVRDGNY